MSYALLAVSFLSSAACSLDADGDTRQSQGEVKAEPQHGACLVYSRYVAACTMSNSNTEHYQCWDAADGEGVGDSCSDYDDDDFSASCTFSRTVRAEKIEQTCDEYREANPDVEFY